MKVAVISDIHGNMPALRRVTADLDKWQPDVVVVAGDVVNRGPLSLDCLHWVLDHPDWYVIRGNHEDYILGCGLSDAVQSGPEFEVSRFAHWVYDQLNGEASHLVEWPDKFSMKDPDGGEFRVMHASMRSNRDGVYAKTPADEIRAQIAPAPAVFVTAHTHRPLIRHVGKTLIVNVGSVGSPFDLDARLSYGRFTWQPEIGWEAEIVRLDYDREQVERDYETSGFLAEGGPLVQLMLVEHRRSGGLIFRWASRYEEAVLAGEMSLEASVRELLQDEDLRPFLGPPGWSGVD